MRITKDHKVAGYLRSIDHELERIAHLIEQIKTSGHPRAEEIVETLCDAGDLTVTPGALALARPLLGADALVEPSPEDEGVETYE